MTAARWQRMFAINVFGTLSGCREAVRRMSTRHGGRGGAIVNLSSVAARLGAPGQYVDYAAAKGAIDVLTLGLAREVAAEGVRVNAVRPGIIETGIHASGGQPDRARRLAPQVPMQRPGTAEEVAEAIVWLLSDAASYTTGVAARRHRRALRSRARHAAAGAAALDTAPAAALEQRPRDVTPRHGPAHRQAGAAAARRPPRVPCPAARQHRLSTKRAWSATVRQDFAALSRAWIFA